MNAIEFFRARIPAMRHGAKQRWKALVLREPCPYCCLSPRADFGKERMTIEHIQPRVLGGSDRWDNLVGAHRGCNEQRSARPLLHFLLYRHRSAGSSKVDRRRLRRELFRSFNERDTGR